MAASRLFEDQTKATVKQLSCFHESNSVEPATLELLRDTRASSRHSCLWNRGTVEKREQKRSRRNESRGKRLNARSRKQTRPARMRPAAWPDAEAALHKSDVTGRFNYTGGGGNGKAVIARNGGFAIGESYEPPCLFPRITRKFNRERADSRIIHCIFVSHCRLGRSFHLSVVDPEHRASKPLPCPRREVLGPLPCDLSRNCAR